MAEFESKIFKSLESLQGSSKPAMECEPAELQAFRDTWIAISTSEKFQQLFKNGGNGGKSYVAEIETAMRGPISKDELLDDDDFHRELGNTVGGFSIKNNEQRVDLERLKLVGACVNLFRRVKSGQPEAKSDGFREAVEKELTARLEKTYEGQDVDLEAKIKAGGNVLNEALSGEQTDLCSHIAGGLPPGLVIAAYPKILEENGKEPQLRVVYKLDESFYLSNEEKKASVDKLYGRGKTTEFTAMNLGDTIDSFKPLYERKDGSWVVELKEPGYFSKGKVTVLTEKHLAGRKPEANVEMDGFTAGEVEQIKIKKGLKSEQALSESGVTKLTEAQLLAMGGVTNDWVNAQANQSIPSLNINTTLPRSSTSSPVESPGNATTSMSYEDFLAKFGASEEQANAGLGTSHSNQSMTSISSSLSQSSSAFNAVSIASSQTSPSIHQAEAMSSQDVSSLTQDPRPAIEAAINIGVLNHKLTPAQIAKETELFILENQVNRKNDRPEITPQAFVERQFESRWEPEKVAESKRLSNAASDKSKAKTMHNELNQSQEGNVDSPKTLPDVTPTKGKKR